MTDFKSEYRPGRGLQVILSAHDKLMMRYGAQRIFEWRPSSDNVLFLSDPAFIERYKLLCDFHKRIPEDQEIILRSAKETMAYAHFGTNTVMFKESGGNGKLSVLEQLAAHEELHIWCQRDRIDSGPHSYHVNEQFIDYLALRALGLLEVPLGAIPDDLHNAIVNALYIHEVLDALGADSDKLLFDICQGKNQEEMRSRLNGYYLQGPPANDHIQAVHGREFYDRFKDLALITRRVSMDPNLNYSPAIQAMGDMMLQWILSRKRIQYLLRSDLLL